MAVGWPKVSNLRHLVTNFKQDRNFGDQLAATDSSDFTSLVVS